MLQRATVQVRDAVAKLNAVCLAAALLAHPISAQAPGSLTVRADNDAFNFWMEPGRRPDREYTSGVVVTYQGGDAPWWSRRLVARQSCAEASAPCRTRRAELGQQIFTAEFRERGAEPPAGSRPNAGWLFARDALRLVDSATLREFGITLGVTGPPALAEATQEFFHALAPGFNRPTDWTTQLGFEPGVIVSYLHSTRLVPGAAGAVRFDVLPEVRVDAGNISTGVDVGGRVRAGVNLRHPWDGAAHSGSPELVVHLGGAARRVLRDVFLDGNTNGDGPRVGHEPVVLRAEWGVRLTWGPVSVAYGSLTHGRTYPTGPASHTWSTLSLSLSTAR